MIKVKVRGLEDVIKFIESVPRGTRGDAIQAIAEYIIGDDRHGLKHYPAYKKVTRRQAFGIPFFSEKQRRWFFWALKSGRLTLPYKRTNKLKNAWRITGDRWRPVIRNDMPYAHHVMSDDRQSRMQKKIGWRTMGKNIQDNMKGAIQKANQVIQAWIKKRT